MKKTVLFAIGPDRPGLVQKITSIIHASDGNIEDSTMATLGGDFALIVLFEADKAATNQIKQTCKTLDAQLSITTSFKDASEKQTIIEGSRLAFSATGHDQPGIVSRLSEVLTQNDVNVVAMATTLEHQAFTGTPLFKVTGKLSIPNGANTTSVKNRLESVCEQLDMILEFPL